MSEYEDRAKKRIQRRKDDMEGENYEKNMHGEWSWKPGKKHSQTRHLKGVDKPAAFEKLDKQLKDWKNRKKAREESDD